MPHIVVSSSVALTIFLNWLGLAAAAAGPDVRQMRCVDARALVVRSSEIVLQFTDLTYDLVKADKRLCKSVFLTERVIKPVADHPACYLGERCIHNEPEIDN